MDDLRRLANRLSVAIDDDAADYEIHGYFVTESTKNGLFTRLFQKMMDERYAGAIRRVGRTRDSEELSTLWDEMRDKGHIAAAYWAFMTHGHVPASMRNKIFGEVHMLSHLAGATFRKKAVETIALRDQLQDALERARRNEAGLHDAIRDRDDEIASLREEIARLKGQVAAAEKTSFAQNGTRRRKTNLRMEKLERALVSARERARQAERSEKALEERMRIFTTPVGETTELARPHMSADPDTPEPDSLDRSDALSGKVVLYIGGLNSVVDRLRTVAAEFEVDLRHHDGGLEQTPQRLDRLLPSVDCVLCPIDCVSHDACIRAKRACQRLEKPFLPLRSASQSSFRTALQQLASTIDSPGSMEQ
ncbi:MAG: DUF2325 domain-containing protein [Pseudomonadota bacterium]